MKKINAELMNSVLFMDLDKTTAVLGSPSRADHNPFTVRSFLAFRAGQGVQEKPMNPANAEKFLGVLSALKGDSDVFFENDEHAFILELLDLFKIEQVGLYTQIKTALKSAENHVVAK